MIVQRESGRVAIIDTISSCPKCQIGLIKPMNLLQGFTFVPQTSKIFIKGKKQRVLMHKSPNFKKASLGNLAKQLY